MVQPDPVVGGKVTAAWGAAVVLPVLDASPVASVAANFTLVDQQAITALDGRLVTFRVQVTSTNALTATSGNLTDVTTCTLSSEYWPDFEVGFPVYGAVGCVAYVQTDGDVRLANGSDTVAAGSNLVISGTYLRDA